MNKLVRGYALVIVMLLLVNPLSADNISRLAQQLSELPQLTRVKKVESTKFEEKYTLFLLQELDQVNKEQGKFEQRVIVCHRGFDRPTVLVTEGYDAGRYLSPHYIDELAELFDANIVVAEYRYFGESMPEPCDWQHLTVENSLYDLHHIRQAMGTIYKEKWIATGISKGGQTTMFYRARFPNDVDISVPYVAPLNKSLEDGRHEPFLRKVADKAGRKIVENFQLELLKRKDTLLPLFKEYCEGKSYEFRLPIEEVYDYSVLEYSFAHWQFGLPLDKVPSATASDQELFDYAIRILEPNYFAKQTPYMAFNVQAVRELGYYGYEIKPFKKYLTINSSKDYMRRLMVVEELSQEKFDPTLYKFTTQFLKKNDPKMVYIYGEYDPWSATGVTWLKGKENIKVYVHPKGSHGVRIDSFEKSVKEEIVETINSWLKEVK